MYARTFIFIICYLVSFVWSGSDYSCVPSCLLESPPISIAYIGYVLWHSNCSPVLMYWCVGDIRHNRERRLAVHETLEGSDRILWPSYDTVYPNSPSGQATGNNRRL